jgi:hypothetical protein
LVLAEGNVLDRLAELGWDDVVAEDPEASIGSLFEEQGRQLAASPVLDTVVLSALGDVAERAAVVYPAVSNGDRPSACIDSRGVLELSGVALAGFDRASRLVAPVPAEDGVALAIADVGDWLSVRPIGGMDPSAGWVAVTGRAPASVVEGDAWKGAVVAARRAIGHELVGMTDRILEIAVEHVKSRVQFGRPIGANQAVKHRLAEVLVTLSAAKAALHESWANADDPLVATVARSIAGRAHAEASRHGQQVCGGIGFTWEFGLHAYIRRGGLLDTLLGSWRGQRVSVGEHVIAAGEAPRVRCL